MRLFLTLCSFFIVLGCQAIDLKAGDNLYIDQLFADDAYLAGGEIHVNAPGSGDLVLAGGTIHLNDSIAGDLTVAGGNISVDGKVGDDIRAAGGQLFLTNTCGGHAMITGGTVTLESQAVIEDDLIIYGGNVVINGTVKGNMKLSGGTVRLNGTVQGNAEMSGGELIFNGTIEGNARLKGSSMKVGESASVKKNLEYWRETGAFPELENITDGNAHYNPELKDASGTEESYTILAGISIIVFVLVYLLSGLLLISLFILLFPKGLQQATDKVQQNFMASFGYGILYFIAIPFIIGFLFTILIGIPVGAFLTCVYVFSILFGLSYSSVMLMYYLQYKTGKSWKKWQATGIAFCLSLILKILLFIPYLGILLSLILVAAAMGGIIGAIKNSKKAPATHQQ